MENNTQLLKGVLEFCVLKFISREPTYGYEIVMHLKQVGFSDLSESTLYPLLLRLPILSYSIFCLLLGAGLYAIHFWRYGKDPRLSARI